MAKFFDGCRLLLTVAILQFSVALGFPGGTHSAAAQVAVAIDCANDLKLHCTNVLPGNDREVACLIAFEDKINPRCRLSVYLASGRISDRARGLRKLAKKCSSDIMQYCSRLPAGGGRIVDCLKRNKATLTDECRKLTK